jgi:transcriptional regulator with XRE-family HTH domain
MQVNSISDLAAAVRGRRMALRLTQAELAARIGVSRDWVTAFEAAKPGVELALVLRLLDALDLRFELSELGTGADSPASRSVDLDVLLEEYRDR